MRDLVQSEYPRLVAAVGLISGSRAAAEDAVLEAFARVWQRIDAGASIASPRAWVTVVANNLARSGLRRMRAEWRARGRLTGVPDDGAARASDLVDLRRALRALPRRQLEATVLRYFLDLDVVEVAAALGVTEGTVKTSLHRARRSLAAALRVAEGPEERDGGSR
ncbi:MAG: sigma-70 family RNA polymerase sigma factor [Acidobacteria bacterium]|nr:sigma-70 family RNA polymerase sigma factor [Acidobacteriota bacterium]